MCTALAMTEVPSPSCAGMITSNELFREARAKSAGAKVLRDMTHDLDFDGQTSEAERKAKQAADVSNEALALRKRAFSLLQEEHIGERTIY